MERREFTRQLAFFGLAFAGAGRAGAQGAGAYVEGRDFVRLSTPVATSSAGKVEVIEFFWYGCPHCNALEPSLEGWVRKLPPDVAFRRVHVAFTALHETHAKLFYALDAMGQVDTMHKKVFAAMHVQRKRLDKEADIVAFVTENGVDGAKFTEAYKSFGVATKVSQAKALSDHYKIDGVPALGVNGRYYTSPALAGGNEKALVIADFLIDRSRRGA